MFVIFNGTRVGRIGAHEVFASRVVTSSSIEANITSGRGKKAKTQVKDFSWNKK